jgi:hypothetical protein
LGFEVSTRSLKQRIGHLLVVDGLEEAKESPFFFIAFIVCVIDDPYDATDDLVVPAGQKSLASVGFIKGMLAEPDELLLVHPNRWYPIRVSLVKPPNELHKRLAVLATIDRGNLHGIHSVASISFVSLAVVSLAVVSTVEACHRPAACPRMTLP